MPGVGPLTAVGQIRFYWVGAATINIAITFGYTR
jgi:hypothetical protein